MELKAGNVNHYGNNGSNSNSNNQNNSNSDKDSNSNNKYHKSGLDSPINVYYFYRSPFDENNASPDSSGRWLLFFFNFPWNLFKFYILDNLLLLRIIIYSIICLQEFKIDIC